MRPLPTIVSVAQAFQAHSGNSRLVLVLLFLSGRRSIDLKRLCSRNVRIENYTVYIYLDYTKTTRRITAYYFEFQWDLPFSLAPIFEEFKQVLSENAQPFASFDFCKLRRGLHFRLHALHWVTILPLLFGIVNSVLFVYLYCYPMYVISALYIMC